MTVSIPTREQLGETLRGVREALGLTQVDVERGMQRLGMLTPHAMVSNIEGGRRGLDVTEAVGLAAVLGIDVDLTPLYDAARLARLQAERELAEIERTAAAAVAALSAARRRVAELNGEA